MAKSSKTGRAKQVVVNYSQQDSTFVTLTDGKGRVRLQIKVVQDVGSKSATVEVVNKQGKVINHNFSLGF